MLSAVKTDAAVARASHEGSDEAASAISDPGLSGPQPLDVLIPIALERNASVRAAWLNVLALRERLPQVTTLDDPTLSNSIFPVPAVAPQYSLMGYMPYDVLLAQQFPWFGTLRLRGEAAEHDVQVALFELAAAQLDVVEDVKRAYHDLHFNERAVALLAENRGLAEDFLKLTQERYQTGGATQADVVRAEVSVSDIEQELTRARGAVEGARAELAQLLRVGPDTPFQTLPDLEAPPPANELGRLYQLAVAARPELKVRLAAIARDEKAVELARKKYCPDVTLGLVYQNMERTNAESATALGNPNVGLFVGFNVPIYRGRLAAGVREAQARVGADRALYEAELAESHRDVKDAYVQADVQRRVIGLLKSTNLPGARQVLETTANDYRAGNPGVDFLSVIRAWRELLQVELQLAELEAELGKSIAALERAVGTQWAESPPDAATLASPPPAPPPDAPGPFQPDAKD